MSLVKTYRGAELNLEHYKAMSVVDFEFEMLNDDDTAMDLSVYSNLVLTIYAKRNGTTMDVFDLNSGLTRIDNFITWDASFVAMSIYRVGLTYYHDCYGVRDLQGNELVAQRDLLFYGNSPIK